ncbi:MAG: hypothetical protein LJE94_13795 [Deltaproteobacteria bacterium]|nr:hypothetical protein [Deltaproteobacteria bacterium]
MWSVTINEDRKLVLVKSSASLDYASIRSALHQIYLKDQGRYSSYDRFLDLSKIGDVNAHFDSIRDQIYWYRKANPFENGVKTAVYLPFGILRAVVEIYVQEAGIENGNLMVTDSVDRCAEYLQVGRDVLRI